jgi:choline-sulfatase
LSIATALSAVAADDNPEKKPNFLFILADDTTYEVIAAAGMTKVKTPNIDRLYRGGVVFTHTYNMGSWSPAVCIASRTMLNSGMTINRDRRGAKQHPLWPRLMGDDGYKTYFTGKWHVSGFDRKQKTIFDVVKHPRPGMPRQTPSGYHRPKDEEDYKNGWKPWDKSKGGFWQGGEHWSIIAADDAIGFIDDAKKTDKPFFIYLGFNSAHDPRQVPKEYVDMYPIEKMETPKNFIALYPDAAKIGCDIRDEFLLPSPRTEYSVKVNRQEYYACVTFMDHQIGRVLDALEKSGQADNTYIIFTADNGLAVGHHGLAGKQNLYDHSVRLPFIIKGPGLKPRKIDTPIYMQDIMPTVLRLAGAKVPEWVEFKSLLPLLKGSNATHYDHIYGQYLNYQRMVTKNGWKLIVYPYAKKRLLFNLDKDPDEMVNLAHNPEYSAKLEELEKLLKTAQSEMGDTLDINAPPPISKRHPRQKNRRRKKPEPAATE